MFYIRLINYLDSCADVTFDRHIIMPKAEPRMCAGAWRVSVQPHSNNSTFRAFFLTFLSVSYLYGPQH